jgi:hypothetical protein
MFKFILYITTKVPESTYFLTTLAMGQKYNCVSKNNRLACLYVKGSGRTRPLGRVLLASNGLSERQLYNYMM